MVFGQCVKMAPSVLGRRLAAATATSPSSCSIVVQPARTFFSPWPRATDIGALIRDMDRQMDRLERQVFRGLPSSFLLPAGGGRQHRGAIDHTVEQTASGDGLLYRVAVDLQGFRPEEISLSLDESGRRLTIAAKCEREHADGKYVQELSRTLALPESIDVAKMSSVLHRDGVLAVEAPFKEPQQQQQSLQQQQEPHRIPISRQGGEQQQQQQQLEQNNNNNKEEDGKQDVTSSSSTSTN